MQTCATRRCDRSVEVEYHPSGAVRRTRRWCQECRARRAMRRLPRKGYVVVQPPKDHPAWPSPVLEHRLVMERHLGRYLAPHENVHHRNGLRDDNRIANLELWTVPQPKGQRAEDLVAWVVENYPAEVAAAFDRAQ